MINILKINDEMYPQKLKKIANPPKQLFYKGNVKLLNEPMIAVIGSRDITEYGKRFGKNIVKELALRNIPIISGMAIGADRIAHEETLNVGGKTIAVMGTGFRHIYPYQNKDIYSRIISEGGLVITEYEDDTQFKSSNFPNRNRIISGLSEAVLILEAKHRSGTSITASFAWKQGKKVYALPGRLDSKNGVGVNNLIRRGAKLVVRAEDILEDFEEFKNKKKRLIIQNSRVKKEYRKIYEILNEEPLGIEEISIKTKNNIRCTSKLLALMEIEDLVEQVIGVRIC